MFLQLIDIVGVIMDRSRMKDIFVNSYDKILNMLSNEVIICKVCRYIYCDNKLLSISKIISKILF